MSTINPVARDEIFMKVSIRCGQWMFSPGLISSFFTLLLIPLFVYLGFWQLQRFDQKSTLKETLESRINEPMLSLGALQIQHSDLEPFRYRRLQVNGIFLNENQILLDNQIFKGRVGFRVITPLLTQENTIILVDRGWIALQKSRSDLPSIPPILGKTSVVGIINQLSSGLQLMNKTKISSDPHWPMIVQRIDFKELSLILAHETLPFILQVDNANTIKFGIPASRHLGYAVQWFGMAAALLIYYLVINGRRLTNV